GRRRRPAGLPQLRVGPHPQAALERVAARPRAARCEGARLRVVAARARGGAQRADRRGEKGAEAMSEAGALRREQLVEVYNEAAVCEKCPLAATRTKVVFGSGNADADLMFVGEAPGAEEDRQGLPFVGRAGALLTELLKGIGMSREDVFIANVLKCRPPGNRDPQPVEIESCEPYLARQVQLIEPRVVCTLGNFATKLLTGSRTGITKVRGAPQVHRLGGRPALVIALL